jgi:hypothetical protein
MPKRTKIPLVASKYDKPSLYDASVQTIKNMYLEEFPDIAGNTSLVALSRPGTSLFVEVVFDDTTGIRGAFVHKDLAYVVVGNDVYTMTANGVSEAIGQTDASTGRVSIAAINDMIVFADGGARPQSYIPSTGTYAEITDVDLPDGVKHVTALNEYFLFLEDESQTIWASDLADGTAISALSFFSAESFYDNARTIKANKGLLYILGEITTEVWFNDGGDLGAPFSRAAAGHIPLGIAAEYTAQIILDKLYWLAQNENGIIGIGVLDGVSYDIIRNADLIEKINGFVAIDDAYSWSYAHNGHHFYCLTFPSAEISRGRTFSYDVTNGVWNELDTFNPSSGIGPTQDSFFASFQMFLGNRQLVTSSRNSKIYELRGDVYNDYVNDDEEYAIQREVIGPHLTASQDFLSLSNLELDVEGGRGLDGSGQGSNPMVGLQVSKDRGHTWSNTKWRSAGDLGDYLKRVRWGSVGGGYSMTFKFIMTDPIHWALLGLSAEIS